MPNSDLKTLRNQLLRQRTSFAQDPAGCAAGQAAIAVLNHALTRELQSIESIALYWPIQQEVDLRKCLIDWGKAKHGRQLALPIMRADKQLDFYSWQDGDALISQQHGISEPNPNDPKIKSIEPDCILIPCVGWSWASNIHRDSLQMQYWRLGYGGGYFDRTLAQAQQILAVGIAYSFTCVDFAVSTHDIALDWIITEEKLI
jgi:5,10-methenyltetrahydrofolate synthetase